MQLQLGDLLAMVVVVLVFIPALRGRSLTTAYEFLEQRFDRRVRRFGSVLFQLQVLMRAGVLVYGPALALSTLTGWPLAPTIVGVGILATTYTTLGGITAVVWTDALQLGVILLGLGACVLQVASDLDGGLTAAWARAAADGRLRLVDPDQPWTSVRSLPGAVLGYGLLSLAVAGTNQQTVQRYLSCRSVVEARRAAWTGWAVGALVTAATLLVGVLLYGYFHTPGRTLPADVGPDEVFPWFVGRHLSPGVAGLLVAAILAAAMSSLDSALNSLATAWVVDLRGGGEDAPSLRRARWATVTFGALAVIAALALAGRGTLLELAVRVIGWFAGPILALFLLALSDRRPRPSRALAAGILGFATVLWASSSHAGWPGPPLGIWATGLGTLVTVLSALPGGRGNRAGEGVVTD